MSEWATTPEATFWSRLDEVAAKQPDATLAVIDDVTLSYGEVRRRAAATADQLVTLGVRPGDRVAIFSANCPEFLDVLLALPLVGAVAIPINTAFSGAFLVHQLRDSATSAMLVDAAFLPSVLAVTDDLPDLRLLIVRGELSDDGGSEERVAVVSSTCLADGDPDRTPPNPLRWDEPVTILYTSGTTGPSKGALVSQHYLLNAAATQMECFGVGADDVAYGALPLFHFGGFVALALGALVRGGTSVIDSAFSVHGAWDRMRRYDATVFFAVGPMVMMLNSLPPQETDATVPVRLIIAAPIPAALHPRLEERYGCLVRGMYGLTEAFPVTVQPADAAASPGAAGRPSPVFDVRLFDDHDGEVATGEIGEIVLRPRTQQAMFSGYAGRPAETLDQFRNLWFHTGDLGRWDDSGELVFVDRRKDAIRRRGENISSFEVERAVLEHPAVAECAAHAVPSPLGEDDVKICVVRNPGASLSEADLWDHCVTRLPDFAVPRYIEFVDQFPKTMTGRVQKNQLRARENGPSTWVAQSKAATA